MNADVFRNISKIIERDSKTTTYKFALLRGVIEIIAENSPYITQHESRVDIPLGLLIEKWLLFYYPIFAADKVIPQIHGNTKLVFQQEFMAVVSYYQTKGGLSSFYRDIRTTGVSSEIGPHFLILAKKIADTIVKMPMKYIGQSVFYKHYGLFTYHNSVKNKASGTVNSHYLIQHYGTFSFPLPYFEAFALLGNFLGGTDSILFKWAEFSASASKGTLSISQAVENIVTSPVTERDVADAKTLYRSVLNQTGYVECVWTSKRLTTYDVDHLVPFTIWKNNDLWNLLPSHATVNNKKRDKIPSLEFLESRRESILHYWHLLSTHQHTRFMAEIKLTLVGNEVNDQWKDLAFSQLKLTSDYLINIRGFQPWTL